MGSKPNYTTAERDYIQDTWGTFSIKRIAKELGRTTTAVKLKAQRMGLTDASLHGNGITVCQLAKAIGREYSVLKYWIQRHDFPARRKVFAEEKPVLVVSYDDFWKWAEEYKELMDFSRFAEHTLGPEPGWVREKRKADFLKANKSTEAADWTPQDDKKLLRMVEAQLYTYPQLAEHFNRAETAIKRRLLDLGTKARPIGLSKKRWTDQQVDTLKEMAVAGYGFNTMAQRLSEIGPQKSELGVRGKLERMHFDFTRRIFRSKERTEELQELKGAAV